MKTKILLILIVLVACQVNIRLLAQCSSCTYTAPSGGTSFNFNGNETLCITAAASNLSWNMNGSGNKICLATGVVWDQPFGGNFGGGVIVDVYGTWNLGGGVNVNGTATFNIHPGAILNVSTGGFGNGLTINNEGIVNVTSANPTFNGSFVFNNDVGGTLNAPNAVNFMMGNGSTFNNNGTMHLANAENEESSLNNNAGATLIIDRSFNNHGAFINNGDFQLPCNTLAGAPGATTCSFRVGDKGAGKEFISNTCVSIMNGNVTFDGIGTVNAGFEIGVGYNLTLNKTVSGTDGSFRVKGGTSTINLSASYIGTNMKFYDDNTAGNDWDINVGNNPSSYTVSNTAGCNAIICTPPSAGSDLTACAGTCIDITGTNPATGTWTAQAGNPSGATIGATISGVANVCFDATSSGTYNFVYNIGTSCEDTMSVVVNTPGSVGNYIWSDLNNNGTNDEPITAGINGVTVELWNATTNTLVSSTTTANDGSNNPGYYNFAVCTSGDYKVKFPTTNGGNNLTSQTTTAATDNNSDASPSDGFSPTFTISTTGTGIDKNNPTIDAGFTVLNPLNTIGNFVWLDDNDNGTQDSGEPGVANVPVTLYNNGLDNLPCTADDIIVESTITDAYGAYLFDNIPDGNYNVGFVLPANYEFASTSGTNDIDAGNSDADTLKGRTSTINLAGGESELDVDAGIIFSTSPALSSLGDYVWYDTNSDGIQDANEPAVAGVTVTLCDAITGNVLALTTTGADGKYIFNDLANGDYKVGFAPKPGTIFTQSNGGTTPGNSTTNSDVDPLTGKTASISITASGTIIEGIDAGLKDDTKASLGDLVWNDLNQNGMQDAGEPGVPGVTMTLHKAGPDGAIGGLDDIMVTSTTTDANGNYWFSNLDPDKYFVTCNPVTGFVLTGQNIGNNDFLDNDFGTNPNYPGVGVTSQVYNLLAGQNYPGIDKGIYNNTQNLGSIGDKVWLDGDADGVQDPSEPGVAGVTICLLDGTGAPVNNPTTNQPYVLQTDANGNYLFVDLPSGSYQVKFKNIPTGTSFSPTNAGNTATDSDPNPTTGITPTIVLASGQDVVDVDAGIVPGIPAGKGSLGNFVWIDANNDGIQDAGEQGAPDVEVELFADANGDGLINGAEATTPIASTQTNPQGYYIFTGLDANTYQVNFVTTTFPSGYSLQTGKNDQGTNDSKDSDPNPVTGLTGLYILAQGEDNMTVDAGLFNTTATNSVGDYVWLDQNANGIQDNGEPGVPGVSVNLLDANGEIVSTTITDANGNFLFVNLPNGSYCIKVNAPNGFTITLPNEGANDLSDSDIDTFTFKTPIVTLSGNTNITDLDAGLTTTRAALGDYVWIDANSDGIQDPSEEAVSGVTVCLLRPGFGADGIAGNGDDALPVASAITDANGFYFFSNLLPGTYDVQFKTIPSGLQFTKQNSAATNDATDSDVDPLTGKISGITLVSGQVDPTNDAGLTPQLLGSVGDIVWFDANLDGIRDPEEAVVPGIIVTLKDPNGSVVGTAITDGNGKFLFNNLAPGSGYTLIFGNLPTGSSITTKGVGSSSTNSDADPVTGVTDPFIIIGGEKTPNMDAGITVYIPLPVVLKEFILTEINCSLTLNWITSAEKNVSHFNVMRKEVNEIGFNEIAKINAKGNSTNEQFYTYQESNLPKGNYEYYLQTVDIDGKKYNSNSSSILLNCESTNVSIYPNPIIETINVKINSPEIAEFGIKITDMIGRTIVQTLLLVENGTKTVAIPTTTFAAGIYQISITDDKGTQTFKVQKSK